nr:unnamed protein product [Callosobruchus analis]
MPKMTRRDEVILTRLRVGHTRLTSMHLLRGEFQPQCYFCDLPLTVQHILNDCLQYEVYKISLMLPDNIQQCLASNHLLLNKIIQSLRHTQLYKKI